MKRITEDLMNGYIDWIDQKIMEGFEPYMLTIMFNQLPGKERAHIEQMRALITAFYQKLVPRLYRRPNTIPLELFPLLLAWPDWPVPKKRKFKWDHLVNIAINDGLHFHAVYLHPPFTRLKVCFETHYAEKQLTYVKPDGPMSRIHVKPITYTPHRAIRYIMKQVERERIDSVDLLVLPKTHDELAGRLPRRKAVIA